MSRPAPAWENVSATDGSPGLNPRCAGAMLERATWRTFPNHGTSGLYMPESVRLPQVKSPWAMQGIVLGDSVQGPIAFRHWKDLFAARGDGMLAFDAGSQFWCCVGCEPNQDSAMSCPR